MYILFLYVKNNILLLKNNIIYQVMHKLSLYNKKNDKIILY